MAGMLRRPRRSAERALAAVIALVQVEPRDLVGERRRRPRRVTLRKQRLGSVSAPGTFAQSNSRRLDLFVPALRRRKMEVTARDAVGKHRLPPSGYSHAKLFPAPDRNRMVRAARSQ
jgi:hypothetical protein